MKYYTLRITKTAKGYGTGAERHTYDEMRKTFETLGDVREYLNTEYANAKTRYKIYRGEGEHVGYIYAFKVEKWGDEPAHTEQHWVEVTETVEQTMVSGAYPA